MKKIFYPLLAGAFALTSCSQDAVTDSITSRTETTTFTLSVDELYTRGTSAIDPARFVMEVWNEDGTTAQNVFENNTTHHSQILASSGNKFTVTLDKTKAYTCLFWADYDEEDSAGKINASSLKSVSINGNGFIGDDQAFYATIKVPKGNNPSVAVTLKRAVGKVQLIEKAAIEQGKTMNVTLTDIYPQFNVLTGGGTGNAADLTVQVTIQNSVNTFAWFNFFANGEETPVNFKFKYGDEDERTISNVPIRQNYITSIRGEYSGLAAYSFAVTTDNTWNTPDNNVVFPAPQAGDYYYKDGTWSTENKATQENPVIGIVCEVASSTAYTRNRVVSLVEPTLAWGPYGVVTGATSASGKENTAKILTDYADNISSYPIFEACKNHRTETGNDGWYIPHYRDIRGLLMDNFDIINGKLLELGETPISDPAVSPYWSSCEFETGQAGALTERRVGAVGRSKNDKLKVRFLLDI